MNNDNKERFVLTPDMHLLTETIQDITLQAWGVIYPVNNDSREVLREFRRWGEEFEKWWTDHDAQWLCEHDYMDEIERFTDQKCQEYLKNHNQD